MFKLSENFDETTLDLLQQTRDYCQRFIAPVAEEVSEKNLTDRQVFRSMGQMGLLGVTAPTAIGGGGMSYLEHCLVVEEIARTSTGIALSYMEHSNACLNLFQIYANDVQKKLFLPKLISGEFIGATAIAENLDFALQPEINCFAELKRGRFVINGEKLWVVNGANADVFVVYARTDNADLEDNITAIIIPGDDRRLVRGPSIKTQGMRGSGMCNISLKDCSVPIEYALGEINNGRAMLKESALRENIVKAAAPMGLLRTALDKMLPQLRDAPDSSSATSRETERVLADIGSQYHSTQALIHKLARNLNDGKVTEHESQSALYLACNLATDYCSKIVGLLGVAHYLQNSSINYILRDAHFYNMGLYGRDQLRSAIGRQILHQ